jgi:hypothetical protein
MKYRVGQVFKSKRYCFEIVEEFENSCVFKDSNGMHFSLNKEEIPAYLKGNGLSVKKQPKKMEAEDEMVSLNEVCQVLCGCHESFLADQVRDHFNQKKQKQDPEYQEFLRLKEKFGQ